MTSIKYIGENKFEITNQLSNCIKHLDKVVSYLGSKTIPSDLSELNNVITEVTAISRVVNTNKEKFSKACQLLNDKESSLASSISALDYFNINQFTYSNGKVGLVSIFGSGADLSFMSSYYNEEKWSSYYGNTLNSLNSEKEKLDEMINGKLTREEYNKLKKKYPNLQFDYNPITGVARLLTPEEVLKLKNDAESHGSINTTDINKYKSEYEKWFKDSYGYSYDQYKAKVTNIENDILQFESLKYSLDQSIKLKDYDNIKNTSGYKDYNQNYYRNHHGISVDEEIKKYSNIRVLDDTGLGTDDYANKSLRYYMNYMTEDQKKMYCYLYTTKGSDEANKYIKALEDDLNKVKGLATADKLLEKIALRDENGNIVTNKVIDNNGNVVDQVIIDSKFLSGNYFDTTMQGLGIGIKNFGEGLGNIFNNEGTISDNQYAQMYIMNYLNNAKEKGQSVDALISDFEISMSIGNMLPSIAASTVVGLLCPPAAFEATILSGTLFETTLTAGTITGNLLMGASAAGNAKNQALLSGAELWKANLYGALNGLSETGLGTVLGNIPGLNNNTKFAMKEILSEGTEEFFQEYVDAGLRAGILGEKIDLDSLSNDAWKSFLYGAATSGIMTGGQTTINLGLHGISYVLNTSNLLNSSVSDGQIIDINDFRNNVANVANNQNQSTNSNPQIINFNDAVQNRGNTDTQNASPKKEYTPPKAEIRKIQLEEDIANNDSIDKNVSQVRTASELVASISNPIDSREALDIIAKAYYNPEFKDYSNHRKVVSAINNGHKKALPSVEAVNKFYQRFSNNNIFRRTKYALSTPQDDYFLHAWSFGFDKYNVSQRLYLNGEIEDTLRFIELFADKCEKKKIPLYFKTGLFKVENNKVECNDLSLTRDDSVVIYANEKYLLDYIFICNEIFSQNPDLKFYSPPVLTGKVSKYVGIGAEIDNGNSYNGVRGDVIAYAFERLELHFINKYGDTVKTANGKLDFNKIKTNKELYEEFLNKLNLYIKNEGIKNGVNENFCGYNKLVINQYAGFKKPNYSNVEWTLDKFATEMEKHDELFGSDSSMLMLYDYLTGLSNIGDFSTIDNLRYVLTSIDRNTLQNYYNTIVQAFNEEVDSSKQLRYIGAKPTQSSNKNYTHDDFVKAMNDYDLHHGKNSSIYLLYKYLKGNIKTDKFDEKSSLLDIVKNIDKNTLIDYYNDAYKVYANKKTKDKVTRITNINHSIANIIDVSTLSMENVGGMFEKGASTVNLNQSYKGFDYVVKPLISLDSTIAEIINNNDGSNILVEITNANELTEELVSNIPDNVSIRISNYNNNYYNTFNNANNSSNGTLRHLTYSALELKEIMDKIKTIESGIDSSWNDYQKAQYVYEYLRDNITYHSRKDMYSILPKEQRGNANRPKHYDGLMSLVDGVSTCQGFAHTYKILLDRLGIECTEVWGQLDGEGQHAYNVVTINDNTFIVDTTRESLERNSPTKYEGTGFGVQNIDQYNAKSDRSILQEINSSYDTIPVIKSTGDVITDVKNIINICSNDTELDEVIGIFRTVCDPSSIGLYRNFDAISSNDHIKEILNSYDIDSIKKALVDLGYFNYSDFDIGSTNDLISRAEDFFEKTVLRYPQESFETINNLEYRYNQIVKETNMLEKNRGIRNLLIDIEWTKIRYGGEYEILKNNIPNSEELLLEFEKINNLDYSEKEEKINDFISKIKNKISNIHALTIKASDDIHTNETLKAIRSIFENTHNRDLLSEDELYSVFINYYTLSNNRYEIKRVEKQLNSISEKLWKNSLSFDNFTNGDDFCFLIHNFTGDTIENSISAMNIFRDNRISASVISNDLVATYGDSRIGFIYSPNSKVITSGIQDLYTIESDGKFIAKNKEYATSLATPEYLIDSCLEKSNNTSQDFDYSHSYNEVLLDASQSKPIALYYIGYGEKELNPKYNELIRVSEKLGLPIVEIDMSLYRENKGMQSLGEQAKDYICRCVVDSYYSNIDSETRFEIYERILKSYKNKIADIFLELKQNNNLSKETMLSRFEEIINNNKENTNTETNNETITNNINENSNYELPVYDTVEEVQEQLSDAKEISEIFGFNKLNSSMDATFIDNSETSTKTIIDKTSTLDNSITNINEAIVKARKSIEMSQNNIKKLSSKTEEVIDFKNSQKEIVEDSYHEIFDELSYVKNLLNTILSYYSSTYRSIFGDRFFDEIDGFKTGFAKLQNFYEQSFLNYSFENKNLSSQFLFQMKSLSSPFEEFYRSIRKKMFDSNSYEIQYMCDQLKNILNCIDKIKTDFKEYSHIIEIITDEIEFIQGDLEFENMRISNIIKGIETLLKIEPNNVELLRMLEDITASHQKILELNESFIKAEDKTEPIKIPRREPLISVFNRMVDNFSEINKLLSSKTSISGSSYTIKEPKHSGKLYLTKEEREDFVRYTPKSYETNAGGIHTALGSSLGWFGVDNDSSSAFNSELCRAFQDNGVVGVKQYINKFLAKEKEYINGLEIYRQKAFIRAQEDESNYFEEEIASIDKSIEDKLAEEEKELSDINEIVGRLNYYLENNQVGRLLSSLSGDEFGYISVYQGLGFNYLRSKDYASLAGHQKISIGLLDKMIDNCHLVEDTVLNRAIAFKALSKSTGIEIKSIEDVKKLIDVTTKPDRNYTSTSCTFDFGAGPSEGKVNSAVIRIYADAGTNAFYFSEVSSINEGEVLLARNTAFRFFDVTYEQRDNGELVAILHARIV